MHIERHRMNHIGWLRAAVLGANDGLLSTASLVLGVAAANGEHRSILIAGMAGLVAGAMSMAAGEYVSVSSQADTEAAGLELERKELRDDPAGELQELAGIYRERGLSRELAEQVARQLMAHNALEAHARDELGITETLSARPVQAAFASAASFAVGGSVPMIVCAVSYGHMLIVLTLVTSIACLFILGALAARIGGAPLAKGALRVTLWGCLAMGVTLAVGRLTGTIATQ